DENCKTHAPLISGAWWTSPSDVTNRGFARQARPTAASGGWNASTVVVRARSSVLVALRRRDLYAADFRAATIWSAVRPTSSAMCSNLHVKRPTPGGAAAQLT